MTWFTSFLVAVISGIVSLFLAGFIANACVSWYRVSSHEGGSGYMVVGVGLAGGIAGVVIGFIVARIVASHFGAGFGKELGGALVVVLLIAGISTLLCWLLADVAPTIDRRELNLDVDWKAEQHVEQEAKFAAIPAHAPVQAWFSYLDYDQPQSERALQVIASRPNLAAELGKLAVGEDAELAGKALRCIEKLPAPTAEFIAPVEAAGRDLIERIRKVNTTTAEADPSYEGAANASIRFNSWMSAVRTLREKCGGDFTPELKTILELSRVRPDSHSMRVDICRVASFYMHEWTGLAPLPDDPKPR